MGSRFNDDESTIVRVAPYLSQQPEGRTPPCLELVRGPDAPRRFALALPTLTLGRSARAQLCVESQSLSRLHMQLTRRDGEVHCLDLESANGVYLNGLRVHSAMLHEGDVLQLGEVTFVFHEGGT